MDKRPQTIKGYCIFMPNLYLKLAKLNDARNDWKFMRRIIVFAALWVYYFN